MLIIQCDTTVVLWRKRASVFDSRSPRILRGKPASGSSPLAGHSGWNLLLLSKEDFQAESHHCCHSTGTPTSPAQIEEKSKTCDTPSFILCQVALWRAIRRQICPICIYTTDSTSLSHEVNKQGVFYSSFVSRCWWLSCVFYVSVSDFSGYTSYLRPQRSCWTLSSLQHPWTTRSGKITGRWSCLF